MNGIIETIIEIYPMAYFVASIPLFHMAWVGSHEWYYEQKPNRFISSFIGFLYGLIWFYLCVFWLANTEITLEDLWRFILPIVIVIFCVSMQWIT